jgi:hypothetical protein
LSLTAETLRVLSDEDASAANGGVRTDPMGVKSGIQGCITYKCQGRGSWPCVC